MCLCSEFLAKLLCRTKKLVRPLSNKDIQKMLFQAVKRKDLQLIVKYYVKGVDGSVIDKEGNNLLHVAVRTNELNIVRAILLLFGYKYDLFSQINDDGLRPDEISYSTQIRECIQMMEKNYKDNTSSSSTRNTADGDGGLSTAIPKAPEHVLVSLDGGGIRGLVLVRILMHIERKLGTKIWDLVDWAAGTSTGGILTLVLSKGKTLEECQQLYLRMKNEVFKGKPPYEEAVLERIFAQVMGVEYMNSIQRPRLLITSSRVDVAPPKLKLFTNFDKLPYDSVMELLDRGLTDDPGKLHIWQVARCTSAAPTYFTPYNEVYADGGLICNNPTLELITEFQRMKEKARVSVKPACVISVGTGRPPLRSVTMYRPFYARIFYKLCNKTRTWEYYRGLYNILLEQITESNGRTVSHSRHICHIMDVPFFRISPMLSQEVRLDETDDAAILGMMWDVEEHLSKSTEVEGLIQLLKNHIHKFS